MFLSHFKQNWSNKPRQFSNKCF